MPNKDFWNVDIEDNGPLLQGVLDVLYNNIEGNKYQAQYQENQSITRLNILCRVSFLKYFLYNQINLRLFIFLIRFQLQEDEIIKKIY